MVMDWRATHSSRKPLIVGTLHFTTCLTMLGKSPRELFQNIDLLEARLDSLPSGFHPFHSIANFSTKQPLSSELTLFPSTWPIPIIATARHPKEGGAQNLTVAQRRHLLEEALPWAFAIDVELRSFKQLASTLAHAKKEKRLVICSFHDFKTVPSLTRLERMASSAQEGGADLFKVACQIRDQEGLLRLLAFQSMMSSDFPIATMGMGQGGKLSRFLLALAGSVLSYGWLYKPYISGQWSVGEIKEHLQFFKKIRLLKKL